MIKMLKNSTIFTTKHSVWKVQDEKQLFKNSNIKQDLIHPISIIKNQNTSQIILSAIRELEDNVYTLQDNQDFKQSIKIFNIFHLDSCNSALFLTLNQLCKSFYPLSQEICNMLTNIKEIYLLQQNQKIQNVLIFQNIQSQFKNEMFKAILLYSLYSQQTTKIKLKYLFINLSGLNTVEQDFQIMKEINLIKNNSTDVYCLSFLKKHFQSKIKKDYKQNSFFDYYFLENTNELINWFQLQNYFKLIIKRKIQQFNPQICILQFHISLDHLQNSEDGLMFENDCILKTVHYFSKLSKEKIIINLIIQDSQQIHQSNLNQFNQQGQNIFIEQKMKLKQTINAIQQGIFANIEIKIVDNRSNSQKLIHFQYLLNQLQFKKHQEEVQRTLNNFICQSPITLVNDSKLESLQFKYIPCIDKSGSILFFEYYFDQQEIVINNSTQIIYRYQDQIVIIFQGQQFKLFYCKIQCSCIKKNCSLLDLKQYQNFDHIKLDEDMKYPTIALNEEKIYLNYGYLGDQIWEFSLLNQSVIIKRRKKLKKILFYQDAGEQQNYILEREGASVFYSQFENEEKKCYFICGGELGQYSPICNIIERIFSENEEFSSGFVEKCLLNTSLKPFQHSLVLEGDKFVIFLPGDFNSKRYKYSQIMNHEHQKYAQVLRVTKNQWKIEKIIIVYENEDLGKQYPIHLMPYNQQNVYSINKDQWIVCFFGLQLKTPESLNQSSQIIQMDEQNQNQFFSTNCDGNEEGTLCQMIIKMDIKYQGNQLYISITPYQFGKGESIIRHTFLAQNQK
ncbi:unnamed protein product [Paramecium sonneborni]|uniref:Uncharacterized protein n=1 Tax=Paramecium sonneborni TaxID=65129 RepID=A0A8S1LR76_9CILI|nr:unnamed protein product [Paramecium sonneborni]